MSKISVIVPVYNVERYLMRCVDSIRRQTYRNIEIILVDDGSRDSCPELCEEIKTMDPRVKVVHKENEGLGFARNSGLDVATGDYVTFVDSDDWIRDEHIDNLYRKIKETGADVVIGSHTSVTVDGTFCLRSNKLKQKIYELREIREEIVLPLIGTDLDFPQDVQMESSSCMNLYRMDVIRREKIRFPSERLAISEDLFFNIDFFCCANRVAVTDETGYFYYENQSSISRKYDSGRLERTVRFYNAMKTQVKKYGLENSVSYRVERTFLMDIRVLVRMIVLSDMTKEQKLREIRKVLVEKQVKSVLMSYPIETYIPAMRLLVKWMRDEKVRCVYWLMQVREYGRKQVWLKIMLKRVGIGK